MTNPDNRLEDALTLWALPCRLSDARAEAIRAAILDDNGESDLPALSYRWWRELVDASLRPSLRNHAVARYLAASSS